ncbi:MULTISPECIES: MBL fold metallo-hydrolase [unclassified Pseudoxanthomonas]|uniref:MBL fold metallo-hydrolase n=1 Tax=unclassified Pseudoxanthomonas TaxID=2645906 RepID=UPI0008F445D4|nr:MULTISPECIES: MBL fold metallo-hydrolase [unclassified Pseudoxanthomonas]SFV27379.1 Glyoxylase, beta-lactamase superfamily II [Pseudoxanthomonas sp. YR558]
MNPLRVHAQFDEATNTVSYVVWDPATRQAAIIDPVLDYDHRAGRASYRSADALLDFIADQGLSVAWILETHAHADHLSAAPYLKEKTGAPISIGEHIIDVQRTFAPVFGMDDVSGEGREFDRLFRDGDTFPLGELQVDVLHTPGHTPACVSYRIGDAVFIGDTMFMPDYGTARADFPGGDARTLYRSIQKLLALPDDTRVYLCHDYKAPGRDHFAWETTVGDEKARNVHVGGGVDEASFVAMREARDATLSAPVLLLPSLQVNIRAGRLPEPEDNGRRYLKIPLKI